MSIQRSLMILALAASFAAGGCQYLDEVRPNWLTQGEDLSEANPVEPRPYPADTPIGAALDIEVVPVNGKVIKLDNRTVQRYENAELWLNQQYAGFVGAIDIGPNKAVALDSFVNEHGERYPIAGFLASDDYSPLVSADLIVDGKMHKLLVRLEDWRHP